MKRSQNTEILIRLKSMLEQQPSEPVSVSSDHNDTIDEAWDELRLAISKLLSRRFCHEDSLEQAVEGAKNRMDKAMRDRHRGCTNFCVTG